MDLVPDEASDSKICPFFPTGDVFTLLLTKGELTNLLSFWLGTQKYLKTKIFTFECYFTDDDKTGRKHLA